LDGRICEVSHAGGGEALPRKPSGELLAPEGIEDLFTKKLAYMPLFQATNYAYLGDKDRALYWLEEDYKHHEDDWVGIGGPADIKFDPAFAYFRSDPRFKELLRRVGLPP
jgi:hypothetical protein